MSNQINAGTAGQQYYSFLKLRQLLFCVLGTVVEYYDYALYGFAAAVLAHNFFPQEDGLQSLMKTYGIFAAGSFAKPLGALIFGYIGDIHGRKAALRWSMLGVIIPTTVIGLLPTYQEWGMVSAYVLLTCRLTQGMFVAGESDGIRLVVYESFLQRFPTLANCVVHLACYTGIFLASQATALAQFQSGNTAWRWPFLLGGVLGLIVLGLRQFMPESTTYQMARQHHPARLTLPLRDYAKPLLATVLLCGAVGGSYHIVFVFMPTFVAELLGLCELVKVQSLSAACLAFYMIMLVVAAFVSDYTTPLKVMVVGLLVTSICIMVMMIEFTADIINPMTWYSLAGACALVHAPGFTLLLPQFHPLHRFRSISLAHAVGSILFSGTAPLIVTALWSNTGNPIAPLAALLVGQGVIAGALVLLKKK